MLYSLCFSLWNAAYFIKLIFLVHKMMHTTYALKLDVQPHCQRVNLLLMWLHPSTNVMCIISIYNIVISWSKWACSPCGWDCGFKSRRGQGYLSLVNVVCSVGSGFWDNVITHSEESYQVCVCLTACVLETSFERQPGSQLACCATENKYYRGTILYLFSLEDISKGCDR
jgi:hypothetical protein